jgi:hypothetical protein
VGEAMAIDFYRFGLCNKPLFHMILVLDIKINRFLGCCGLLERYYYPIIPVSVSEKVKITGF